jgi:hypothetical protein
MTRRQYRLVVPKTDDGKEAVATGGEVLIEIADAVGNRLVRNQRRVSVENLVRTLFLDDTLNRQREMDCPDLPAYGAGRLRSMSRVAVE